MAAAMPILRLDFVLIGKALPFAVRIIADIDIKRMCRGMTGSLRLDGDAGGNDKRDPTAQK